ncbi:MAG TPA: caspase family protein, partial [Myxococcota bacterium]|nr:caspase family protein [Myxococcota bacterium]
MRRWASLALLWPAIASAGDLRRFAFVVGANQGGDGRTPLRYAVDDARSVLGVLQELGGVRPVDGHLLEDPTWMELDVALEALGRDVREARRAGDRVELVVYYSGHSDERGLLLGPTDVAWNDLRGALSGIPADVRVTILDSCASGALLRSKGGAPAAPFLVDRSSSVTGEAFLTSSTAEEASQESDRIGGSFFTWHLVAALRGAADADADGVVTLSEAYDYTFRETRRSTENTLAGPQHPNYALDLKGQGDFVMTDLRAGATRLVLDDRIDGRLWVADDDGDLFAEVDKVVGSPLELSVPAGRYRLTLQAQPNRWVVDVVVPAGGTLVVDGADFARDATALEETGLRGGAPALRTLPAGIQVVHGVGYGGPRDDVRGVAFDLLDGCRQRLAGCALEPRRRRWPGSAGRGELVHSRCDDLRGELAHVDGAPGRAHRDDPLDFVLQLADVAGPPVLREHVEDIGPERDVRLAQSLCGFAQEQAGQMRDLLPSLAQRRHVNANDAQPVVEVLAESPFGHALLEVGIGRRNHADIDLDRARVPHRHDLGLLEEPEQFRLHVEWQVADLVEEERASGGGANQPGRVRHGAGERATSMAEQLAVSEVPPGCRAVIGQEQRATAVRAHMNGACHQLLAGPALACDQHVEVVGLQPLDLVDHAAHHRTRAQETRKHRLERPLARRTGRSRRTLARRGEREPLPRDSGEHAQAADGRVAKGRRPNDEYGARPFRVAPEGRHERVGALLQRAFERTPRMLQGGVALAPDGLHDRDPVRRVDEHHGCHGITRFEQRGRGFTIQQFGELCRLHDPAHQRIVCVGLRDDVLASAEPAQEPARGFGVEEVPRGAEFLEHRCRRIEMALRHRPCAGMGEQAADGEAAARGQVTLPEQVEQRATLGVVVIGLGRAIPLLVQQATDPEVLGPDRRRGARRQLLGHLLQARLCRFEATVRRQRFRRNQRRLQGIERRRASRDGVIRLGHRLI